MTPRPWTAADLATLTRLYALTPTRELAPLLGRSSNAIQDHPDFELHDKPHAGFWREDLGVFVVPKAQVRQP